MNRPRLNISHHIKIAEGHQLLLGLCYGRKRISLLLCLLFSTTIAFAVGNVLALKNYSGTYNVEFLCAGHGVLTIEQSGSDVAFSIDGVSEGTGTVSDNTMNLAGEFFLCEGGTLTLDLTFSVTGDSFDGTAVVNSGNRSPESFIGRKRLGSANHVRIS